MSISYIVFAYRKFKVNKDKEENSAMSTEILFSVDTDRGLPSLDQAEAAPSATRELISGLIFLD